MSGTRHLARVTGTIVAESLRLELQYRVNLVVWALTGIVEVLVYLSVWRAVAAARGGDVAGYDARAFAGYFVAMMIIQHMGIFFVRFHLPGLVRRGELSGLLLHPVHPLYRQLVAPVGYKLLSLLVVGPVALVCVLAYDARLDVTWSSAGATLLVLPLCVTVRFLVDALIGCAAFWFTQVDGISGAARIATTFLGGQFAPIAVLPGAIAGAATVLPFWWAFGYPAELLTGSEPASSVVSGVPVLAAWTLVLGLAVRVVWRAGIRRYEAVGA